MGRFEKRDKRRDIPDKPTFYYFLYLGNKFKGFYVKFALNSKRYHSTCVHNKFLISYISKYVFLVN